MVSPLRVTSTVGYIFVLVIHVVLFVWSLIFRSARLGSGLRGRYLISLGVKRGRSWPWLVLGIRCALRIFLLRHSSGYPINSISRGAQRKACKIVYWPHASSL